VTIKHPPDAIDGHPPDKSVIGKVHDLPPQVAILMMAAGWVRSDKRTAMRRSLDQQPPFDRRQPLDRRSIIA
jgi:hypothetical protein